MGHRSISVLAVPVASLEKTPEAFQAYVADYFKETNILGIPCMVAFLTLSRPTKKGGVAPGHASDLAGYETGLGKKSLYDWIGIAAKKGIIWEYWAAWDDDCMSCVVED